MLTKNLSVNDKGHLMINGCDTVDLVKEFGTPMYAIDEDYIRFNCRTYKKALDKFYGGNGMIAYASKAFNTIGMCKIIADENLGIDVVSGGELFTAIKAGFPAERIIFHGNNKTPDEIEYALRCNVGRFVSDSLTEVKLIDTIAGEMGKKQKILMRITPGIDAHTHDFVRTGQIDSKFGFTMENGSALDSVSEILSCSNIELAGVHCHIGSQIFDIDPFELAAKVLIDFINSVKLKYDIVLTELNLGGGLGVKYTEENDPVEYDKCMQKLVEVVKSACSEYDLPLPFLMMEPGRSIVASAGITLYTVGNVKEIPNVRTYVSVDGGMTDNPRYALYGAKYTVLLANKANEKPVSTVTIAGKCCESGDIIQKDVDIADVKPGDILAVLTTGAYNFSMASNYNRIPRPPVIMIRNGKPYISVKRETYDDIIRNDIG